MSASPPLSPGFPQRTKQHRSRGVSPGLLSERPGAGNGAVGPGGAADRTEKIWNGKGTVCMYIYIFTLW